MKKLLWILFCLAGGLSLGIASAQTPPPGIHTGINTTWTAPAGVPCSATVTKACIEGYTETITPPAGVTGTNTVPSCSATVTTGCIGPAAVAYLWKPGGNLYCGTWKISLVTNGLDDTGTAATSTAATTTTAEPCPFVLGPPTNPKATPQ